MPLHSSKPFSHRYDGYTYELLEKDGSVSNTSRRYYGASGCAKAAYMALTRLATRVSALLHAFVIAVARPVGTKELGEPMAPVHIFFDVEIQVFDDNGEQIAANNISGAPHPTLF